MELPYKELISELQTENISGPCHFPIIMFLPSWVDGWKWMVSESEDVDYRSNFATLTCRTLGRNLHLVILLFLLSKMKVIIFLPVKFLGNKDQVEKGINTLNSEGVCDLLLLFAKFTSKECRTLAAKECLN